MSGAGSKGVAIRERSQYRGFFGGRQRKHAVSFATGFKTKPEADLIPFLRGSLLWAMIAVGLLTASCPAQTLLVSNEKSSGIYAVNEPIRWRIEYQGQREITSLHFVLKSGDLTVMQSGDLPLSHHIGLLETKLDAPGTVMADFTSKGAKDALGKPLHALGGAIVAPEQIKPSAPAPADFDAFWQAEVAQVSKVPLAPVLQDAPSDQPGVSYWKIALDNIRGTHVQGQLARPTTGAKLPALLAVQYAGVYALRKGWATDYARRGWLALDIEAHDMLIDESNAFYQNLMATRLKDYPTIGNDDREQSYFLRMYLGCYQAARYLMQRPDWDGKTLIVTGNSQGGMQTLITAGLVPQVTAAICCVPAGCDMTGPQVGRLPGWPRWYYATDGKDAAKVIDASRYYDAVNFARNIHCPLLMGVGLVDETVPAAGAIAAFNQAQGPKYLVAMPRADHTHNQDVYWKLSRAWIDAIEAGKPVPTTQPAPPSTQR